MKAIKIILNWLLFAAIIAAVYAVVHFKLLSYLDFSPSLTSAQVLFFALALAFCWVEILKIGITKPFNCVKCMCGWFALILAVVFKVDHPYLYLPGGVFVGAMYSGIKMNWL